MVSAPSPPDPKETAEAQAGYNRDTAITQQNLNMVNQYTPDGSLEYEQTGTRSYVNSDGRLVEDPIFSATTTLSPEQQKIKTELDATKLNLGRLANDQTGFLKNYLSKPLDTSGAPDRWNYLGNNYNSDLGPDYTTSYAGADDFSADRQKVENALMTRMQPSLDQDSARIRTQLINAGLRPGSQAYADEMDRMTRGQNDARMSAILGAGTEQQRMVDMARDAAQFGNQSELARKMLSNDVIKTKADFQNNSRAQYLQELYARRNQPLNEIGALMGGSQIAQPNFVSTPQTGVAGVDYTGLVNQKYQAEMQNHQNMMGGMFGLLSAPFAMFSDERLKTDIRRVGVTEGGLPVYTFRYKGDPVTHMGVMAQDVEQVDPAAVHTHSSGFKMVDYARVQ
jgi:hypothetical protein